MSTHRPEKRSGGLESEDLDLLFPSPDTEVPSSTPAELAKATSHLMIDELTDPKPQPKRIHGERQPSDRTWREEIYWILQGRREK